MLFVPQPCPQAPSLARGSRGKCRECLALSQVSDRWDELRRPWLPSGWAWFLIMGGVPNAWGVDSDKQDDQG